MSSKSSIWLSENKQHRPKSYIFWDITPCTLMKVNCCFRGTYLLHLQGWSVCHGLKQHKADSKHSSTCLAYFSTLKMETICSSETSVHFHQIKQHNILENRTFYNTLLGKRIPAAKFKILGFFHSYKENHRCLNTIKSVTAMNTDITNKYTVGQWNRTFLWGLYGVGMCGGWSGQWPARSTHLEV
jgi:hypothetical protein